LLLLPRQATGFGGLVLLINLGLQSSFDLGNLLIAAKLVLDPTDHDVERKVGVGDQFAFGALKADAAIGAGAVGAVVGGHGVVNGVHIAVAGFTLQVGDCPGKCGHGLGLLRHKSSGSVGV